MVPKQTRQIAEKASKSRRRLSVADQAMIMQESNRLNTDDSSTGAINQTLDGVVNVFATLSNKSKTVAKTFKELSDEELEIQNQNHRNALATTMLQLVAGVVVILAALLVFEGALEFITSQFSTAPTMYFCWIMTGVVALGLFFVLRTLAILSYEYKNLMEVFRKSRKLTLAGRKTYHFSELLPSAQWGICFDKVDAVFRIAEENGTVPHQAMADILLTKQSVQDEIPNFLANALTMIGLIGTIIGLTGATEGMEGLIETIGDYNQLKESLNATLQGIGVAFFTTLFGAFGMLLLKYFNIVARNARIVFLTELEQVVLTELLPKLKNVHFRDPVKKKTKAKKSN